MEADLPHAPIARTSKLCRGGSSSGRDIGATGLDKDTQLILRFFEESGTVILVTLKAPTAAELQAQAETCRSPTRSWGLGSFSLSSS